MRLSILAVALLAGCSDAPNIPGTRPAFGVKRATVNGLAITSYDGSQTVDAYRGRWQAVQYGVLVPNRRPGMDGILQSVRVNWPDRDYYTCKPQSWPSNSSVRGVLRGPTSGGTHAQFEIQSDAGFILIEFFAETNCLNEDFFASFFGDTITDADSYRFPNDGDGHIETSPLYPPMHRLPDSHAVNEIKPQNKALNASGQSRRF
jgi:hypothetical protein